MNVNEQPDGDLVILEQLNLDYNRADQASDGSVQEALYTDAYQKRDGVWVCISACAIAPGA